MINAVFDRERTTTNTEPLYQWDYGQVIRIQGIKLPPAVEIHFADEFSEDSITRIGTTKDGVTEVTIPDSLLERAGKILSYIYVSNTDSGKTEYKISTQIKDRAKPEAFDTPGDEELFHKAIEEVNASAMRSEAAANESEKSREEAEAALQNTEEAIRGIEGHVSAAKNEIDAYVSGKEQEIKGDTGDVSFASFAVKPPRILMFNDKDKTHIQFTRKGSRLSYKPHFPERT